MKERRPERISPDEYEQMIQLSSQARRLMEAAVGLASRLRPTVRRSLRFRGYRVEGLPFV